MPQSHILTLYVQMLYKVKGEIFSIFMKFSLLLALNSSFCVLMNIMNETTYSTNVYMHDTYSVVVHLAIVGFKVSIAYDYG